MRVSVILLGHKREIQPIPISSSLKATYPGFIFIDPRNPRSDTFHYGSHDQESQDNLEILMRQALHIPVRCKSFLPMVRMGSTFCC